MASPAAIAQPATPTSAPAPAGGELTVIVLEVKGTVQVSTDEAKTWTPAKTGMRLAPGASFRTGFRSSVTCGIPPDQGFTLESLGTVRVDEAMKKGKRFTTDLAMKYGATTYSIEAGGAEHETTVRTPGSTLSVRGTVVRVTDRPGFAPTAESFTGRAVYKAGRLSTVVGKKGGGYARVAADQSDAAQTALNAAVVDPATALARTTTDAQLIAQQTSLGALVSFDNRANITVVRNGAPLSDAALLSSLPGPLDFVLRWTGNADLNLVVDNQPVSAANIARGQQLASSLSAPGAAGLTPVNLGQIAVLRSSGGFTPQELLFPGFGLNVSQSGGVIPYDNRGGPRGGMEIAYWSGTPPQGIYGVSALHASGAPANVTINAFYNGVPLNIFSQGTSSLVKGPTLSGTSTASNSGNANGIVFVPANPFFDNNPNVPSNGSVAPATASPRPAHAAALSAAVPRLSVPTAPPGRR